MENKTVSEFDKVYYEKWEELVKGGVSTLDDPVSGVSEAHFQAYVYAEEITGTLARQYWPIVMDGKKNKTMEEFKYQLPDNADIIIEDEVSDSRGTRFTVIGKLNEKSDL